MLIFRKGRRKKKLGTRDYYFYMSRAPFVVVPVPVFRHRCCARAWGGGGAVAVTVA